MRGGNTSFSGSLLSMIVLFPIFIFLAVVWVWDFMGGFLNAAYEHFFEGGDDNYKV
jgi:hypothetical protein